MTTTLNTDYYEDTTIMPTISPESMAATTMSADSISSASPTIMDMWMSQLQKDHPEISFVIPSQHDNQHIDNMMNFKNLLEKVGNTAYDTISSHHQHTAGLIDSLGQPITHEQISKSAVLNMAELKDNAMSGLERFFAGADMNSLINYLWIGVVTSLVILTVIFVLFSCYFYRKFREWKKCNKDIRAHLNNDMYPGSIVACNPNSNPEAAYYQMDAPPPPAPPCYTIATGLPSYDEALHHQQQHFAFGMKFIYPTLTAVHHQATNLMSSWEKYDMQNTKEQKPQSQQTKASRTASPSKQQTVKASKCKSTPSKDSKSVTALLLPPPPPPCYVDAAASVALLAAEPEFVTCESGSISIAMPEGNGKACSDLTDIITV